MLRGTTIYDDEHPDRVRVAPGFGQFVAGRGVTQGRCRFKSRVRAQNRGCNEESIVGAADAPHLQPFSPRSGEKVACPCPSP